MSSFNVCRLLAVVSIEQKVLTERPSPYTVLEWLAALNVTIKNKNNKMINFEEEFAKWNAESDQVCD